MSAATKTRSAISILGEQLRRNVDGDKPNASADYRLGSQQITVGHIGAEWRLTITDDSAIQPHTADLWAAAVGAPSTEWERTEAGRHWTAQWVEGAK